jgi:DNA replication protein DnaC
LQRRNAIGSAGSPEAWLAAEHPRLLPLLRGASTEALCAESGAVLADSSARLTQCAHCPAEGGACDKPPALALPMGHEPTWDGRELSSRMCCRWRGYERLRSLLGSGVPRSLVHASFENFRAANDEQKLALETCVDFVERFDPTSGRGLLLVGPPGVGKSHLCVAILRALRDQHPLLTSVFAEVPIFLDEVQSNIGKPSSEDRFDATHRARVCRLLVLDDLSAERKTQYTRDVLAQIMRLRTGALRPMLVTTNAKPRQLNSYFGEATVSRVVQVSTEVFVGGKNLRIDD